MALPPFGLPCKIRCTAYTGSDSEQRFADLSGSTTNDPGIIGFRDMGPNALNQQWTITQLSEAYGYMTIETNAKEGRAFANVNHVDAGETVYGVPESATGFIKHWWLEFLGSGLFRIYTFGCNGIPCFWTLGSERETELIRLQVLRPDDKTQIWEINQL